MSQALFLRSKPSPLTLQPLLSGKATPPPTPLPTTKTIVFVSHELNRCSSVCTETEAFHEFTHLKRVNEAPRNCFIIPELPQREDGRRQPAPCNRVLLQPVRRPGLTCLPTCLLTQRNFFFPPQNVFCSSQICCSF